MNKPISKAVFNEYKKSNINIISFLFSFLLRLFYYVRNIKSDVGLFHFYTVYAWPDWIPVEIEKLEEQLSKRRIFGLKIIITCT